MKALLISTYELGRQPFGLASPAAWLKADGWDVVCADTAKAPLQDADVATADIIGVHLPMHTATRLAEPILVKARHLNPRARLCAYGLYAPLNRDWLHSLGVEAVFGGEFEGDLAGWAKQVRGPAAPPPAAAGIPRLKFVVPDRSGLPPLAQYATLEMPDGGTRVVGSTEATRGCKHLCRHCPIVPIYDGQFRVVQADVVLADIDAQVAAGAQHITFGDPDFLNGPTHAMRIVEALHRAHPDVSYDVTVKVEHLLAHRELLPRLAATGCAFVTSAVESIDDHVLTILDKGHTRAGFEEAVALCREAGVTLIPTFVAFHPWLSLDGYVALLDTIARLDLVEHVAPVQLTIRLLLPQGSRLLEVAEMRECVGRFEPATLTHEWRHPDPRVDALQQEVSAYVAAHACAERRAVFAAVWTLAHQRAGRSVSDSRPLVTTSGRRVPHLSEPWYCCAEPVRNVELDTAHAERKADSSRTLLPVLNSKC